MTQTTSSNIAQIEYWNTKAGETWTKFQEALDRQIETLGLAAVDTLKPGKGEHISQIRCRPRSAQRHFKHRLRNIDAND